MHLKKVILSILVLILIQSCATTKHRPLKKEIEFSLESTSNKQHFIGFMLYDPATKDTLYHHNANKYFTPASNTKIFTLYAALQLLPDSIPALNYVAKNDSLFVEGTGDPSFLHPYFKDSTALTFLKNFKHTVLYSGNFQDDKYGPGWAWEDYDGYYSPERGGLPLYGNVTTIFRADSLMVSPAYFKNRVNSLNKAKNRELNRNIFAYNSIRNDTLEVPFVTDTSLTKALLEGALHKKITIDPGMMPQGPKEVLYSIPSDSLYKRMMHLSDNFIAEQLLILGASTLSDTLTSATAREHVLENHLSNLRQSPRWVDGSGLSRYNLFSPESIIDVLNKLYTELPKERLFHLFPAGGESGTLKDWYKGNPHPYIYAKSGSLGNNYCLSGYLITTSGKTLLFSYMNNHFRTPTAEIKEQMEVIFQKIRENY